VRQTNPETGRHPGFVDMTGQTFGFLTVVREMPSTNGNTRWLCTCPRGAEVVRAGITLRNAQNARCQKAPCPCSGAAKATPAKVTKDEPASVQAPAPALRSVLDVERNRERYVRHRLHLRSLGLEDELPAFAELTCAECPEAPRCRSAFRPFNVDGECLEDRS